MKTYLNSGIESIQKHHGELIQMINEIESNDSLPWQISELLPRSKKTFENLPDWNAKKEYLKKRLLKETEKKLETFKRTFAMIENSNRKIERIIVTIEWKNNRTWGANPTAHAEFYYSDGGYNSFKSESVSGCGYDKESTAFAQAVNQDRNFINMLFKLQNSESYGFSKFRNSSLPNLSDGVGVSCYYRLFDELGYQMEKTASGKMFDVYSVTKL